MRLGPLTRRPGLPSYGPESRGGTSYPFARVAADLGQPRVKNAVALGAFQAATRLFPEETFLHVLRQASKDGAMAELNAEAFARGGRAFAASSGGPSS